MGFEEIGGEDEDVHVSISLLIGVLWSVSCQEKLTPISGVMELTLPSTLQEGCKGICSKKAWNVSSDMKGHLMCLTALQDVDSCTKKGKTLEATAACDGLCALPNGLSIANLKPTRDPQFKLSPLQPPLHQVL